MPRKVFLHSDSDTIIYSFVVGFVYHKGKAVVHMTLEVELWLHRGRKRLACWWEDKRLRISAQVLGHALAGFLLSAGALGNQYQPLAMGLILCCTGWRAPVMTLGSLLGYRVFWGESGIQGMVWVILGCVAALGLGKRKFSREAPLLMPMLAAFLVSATGLVFQLLWHNGLPFGQYLLRVVLAGVSTGLFAQVVCRRDTVFDWAGEALAVLALAQVAPIPWLGLGYLAAGIISTGEVIPAGILAGLALDLAQVTPVPMTAVLALACLSRMLPGQGKWTRCSGLLLGYTVTMVFCGSLDLYPLPGLLLGGLVGTVLPHRRENDRPRGETGRAQVRLELMAGVLSQIQQLLLEAQEPPIDEEAILLRTRERACGGCPNRRQCRQMDIPPELLQEPLTDISSLPIACRKPGRMVLELRRGQEQLRFLQGEHRRRREYREAVVQQYRFLGEYLRQTADTLPRRTSPAAARFSPDIALKTRGKENANGDRCIRFAGMEPTYYVLLCDGMGTGLGAAEEARLAGEMLQQMLISGFPAEYALESLNSLTALRGLAGAVTVDLAELRLDMGTATLYKWGAPPSWLLGREGVEKIGTAAPPPGIWVGQIQQRVERLSLRRGEVLILSSDGVAAQETLLSGKQLQKLPPGEIAAYLLDRGTGEDGDDATCVVIHLKPTGL